MVVGLSLSLFLYKLHYVTLCNNRDTLTYTCTYFSDLILTLATKQISLRVLGIPLVSGVEICCCLLHNHQGFPVHLWLSPVSSQSSTFVFTGTEAPVLHTLFAWLFSCIMLDFPALFLRLAPHFSTWPVSDLPVSPQPGGSQAGCVWCALTWVNTRWRKIKSKPSSACRLQ